MRIYLQALRPALTVWIAAWLLGGLLFFWRGYEGSFLLVNHASFWVGDKIFPHLTNLGDGLAASAVLVLLCWRRGPTATTVGILSIILTGILVQVLKHQFFASWERPLGLLGPARVHFFPGEVLFHGSFPSGHAMTATAGALCAALAYRERRWVQYTATAVGLLICYSRVYVGSHFLGDVLWGSIVSAIITLLLLRWFYTGLEMRYARLQPTTTARLALIMQAVAVACLVVTAYIYYQ